MKKTPFLLCFIMLSLIISCNSGDDSANAQENFANRQSTCNNVIGYSGGYWDFSNGQVVPWPVFPALQNPGDQFIHSAVPTLGFTIPQGYTATQIPGSASSIVGVNVAKNDNSVIYTWIPTGFTLQTVPSQDIIASYINQVLDFYEFNGTPEVLCSTFRDQVFAGIPRQFNARLIRFNNQIAQVWVITNYVASGTSFSVSISTSPENEYESDVLHTFLPMIYQLFADPNGNITDNDGDGWNVLVDPNDNDPSVP